MVIRDKKRSTAVFRVNTKYAAVDNFNPPPAISADDVEKVILYLRLLGVPANRMVAESVKWPNPDVQGLQIKSPSELANETQRVSDAKVGKTLFAQAQCTGAVRICNPPVKLIHT